MAKKSSKDKSNRRKVFSGIDNFEVSGDLDGYYLETDDTVEVANYNINSVNIFTSPISGADQDGGPSNVCVQIIQGMHKPANQISRFPPNPPDGYTSKCTSTYTDLGNGNKKWEFSNFYAQGYDPAVEATVIAWAQYNKSGETVIRYTYRWFYLFSESLLKRRREKDKPQD